MNNISKGKYYDITYYSLQPEEEVLCVLAQLILTRIKATIYNL